MINLSLTIWNPYKKPKVGLLPFFAHCFRLGKTYTIEVYCNKWDWRKVAYAVFAVYLKGDHAPIVEIGCGIGPLNFNIMFSSIMHELPDFDLRANEPKD